MPTRNIATVTALAFLMLVPAARAAAGEASETEVPARPGMSYRMQILAGDLTAASLFVAAGLLEGADGQDTNASGAAFFAGLGGYALHAPVVHAVHKDFAIAAASLALRVAFPVAGAYIGGHAADCSQGEWLCGIGEALVGFAAGAVVASAVDVALLTGDDDRAPTTERPRDGFTIAPSVAVTPQMAF